MKKSILKVVHDAAKGLQQIGLIDANTMRKFDAKCLPPIKDLTPRQIKSLRVKEQVSQPVFAAYLNISPSTVKKWETGEKHPHGASLKLLNVIAKKGLQAILY
jgi:putative transcriptional regulator